MLYVRGPSTVAEVASALPVTLSRSAVRAMLTRLAAKGIVKREADGRGFVFSPAVAKTAAKTSELSQVVRTFFSGSPVRAATALLGMSGTLEPSERDELDRLIARAREMRGS